MFTDFAIWTGILNYLILPLANQLIEQNYVQPVVHAAVLTGKINDNYNNKQQADIDASLTAFKNQASYQHTYSYPSLLGVSISQIAASLKESRMQKYLLIDF